MKLRHEAKMRGKGIFFFVVTERGDIVKLAVYPNGQISFPEIPEMDRHAKYYYPDNEKGFFVNWMYASVHKEYGRVQRRFLNYWNAYAYQQQFLAGRGK